jgi:hypothetical protein
MSLLQIWTTLNLGSLLATFDANSLLPSLPHVIPPETQPPPDPLPRSLSDMAPDEIQQRIPLIDKPVSAVPWLLSTLSTDDIDVSPNVFAVTVTKSAIRAYLQDKDSNIIAATAGRQSSNGLVESHWKVMVHMSCAYLTEKQMPRRFWFHSISHAARMMNMSPGKFHGELASPFILVNEEEADQRTWIPIFSVCYFHHH